MISKDLKIKIKDFKLKSLKASRILIVTHQNPDGDAIGSSIAMRIALNMLGKSAEMVIIDAPPEVFSFLPYFFSIKDKFSPFDFDMAILLDCGNWQRTGFFEDNELNIDWPNDLVVIDHHALQKLTPGLHIIETSVASATQLVFYIFNEWGLNIPKDAATCLMTGLSTDTGSFKHSNTTAEVFRVASRLMELGANLHKIASNLYLYNSQSKLRLWGSVLDKIKLDKELGIVFSIVTNEDLAVCGASINDLEGVIDLMNSIPGVKATMLFSERDKGFKVSLRTESDNVDVSKLAAIFGGGGHVKAAGFSIDQLN